MLAFADIERVAMALPGVEPSTTNGSAAFRVRGRLFLHVWDDGDTLVIRVGRDEKQAVLDSDPERFFVNRPHERSPALLTRMSDNGTDDLDELADLIEQAWRRHASADLRRQLDER